jgi:hypothetical protein
MAEWWEIDEHDATERVRRLFKAAEILRARCDGNEDAEHALDVILNRLKELA